MHRRIMYWILTATVVVAPIAADISDGPDVQRDKSCGNIVVDVLIDGEFTQYIVPDGPGRLERLQKQLFDDGRTFGQTMRAVSQVRKGLRELETGFDSGRNLLDPMAKPEDGEPGCSQCLDGRDQVGPPIDCYVGLRPYNCTHCRAC